MAKLEQSYTLHRLDEADDKPSFLAEHGPYCVGAVTNGHAALTRADLEHLPKLEIVACSSAGFDTIDTEALRARRQLFAGHAHVVSGEWGRSGPYPLLSCIRGKRAGILGLGQIGRAIGARFEPLGLEIGYCTRRPRDAAYRYFDNAMALAEWADILVLAIPGGDDTIGLVGGPMLEALGPQGTLINIARGTIVDEPALIAALVSGKLGSAGLDVFLNEPDPDPALTALPNVTLYPHHASGTVETREAMAQLVVDNLAAHFAGRPLLTPVYDLPARGLQTA